MGHDGTIGCQRVKEQGGRVIAQDEETSVIFSMPSSVINRGYVDAIRPLHEIALEIQNQVVSL